MLAQTPAITTANYIGISRVVLWTPLAVIFVLLERWDAAFVAVAISGISDIADGVVARREKTISNFGAYLDLTADKVFVSAMLICFAFQGLVPLWAVMTIMLREFLVMGLRCYAAAEHVSIPADRTGRLKCFFTFVAILAIVLRLPIAPYLLALACALTVVSGGVYFYRAKFLLVRHLRYAATEARTAPVVESIPPMSVSASVVSLGRAAAE